MAARSRLMIGEAERRFPVRIKIAVPEGGFGKSLTDMHRWLDDNCGAECSNASKDQQHVQTDYIPHPSCLQSETGDLK